MKIITIDNKEYKIEYSFEAAEYKELVQRVFKRISGIEVFGHAKDMERPTINEIMQGSLDVFSDTPELCKIMFYGGLMENNRVPYDEASTLMKKYMKENKLSYQKVFEELKTCMEDDGFFDLSGISELLQSMEQAEKEITEKLPKVPQDHKKKQTGTK